MRPVAIGLGLVWQVRLVMELEASLGRRVRVRRGGMTLALVRNGRCGRDGSGTGGAVRNAEVSIGGAGSLRLVDARWGKDRLVRLGALSHVLSVGVRQVRRGPLRRGTKCSG